MKKYAFLLFLLLMTASQAMAQRTIQQLSSWEFSRDSVNWERVAIPHDWAISGPFDKKYDLQYVAIEQNGETEKTEKSGRSGALPWIGKGYYRTTVNVDTDFHYAELFFDGAMSEPVVRVNGKVAGQWAYGYNAFRIDVTPFLRQGNNTIEVSLSNVEESSRWYPGGGLYRPVELIAYRSRGINARIVDWECFFQTLEADAQKAKVMVTTKVENCLGAKVEASLTDEQGDIVASGEMEKGEDGLCNVTFEVDHPQLWSPETPYLYTLTINTRSAIRQTDPTKRVYGIALTDSWTQKVGIRTLSFTKEKGFQLNGQTRKIKGVCLHHDLGPLGAAVNKAALIRQIKIMKDMGCDAIRTAHNMPSTMQMEVCDSMGMMVMAESFDMWIYPKCQNGYARFFKEWADRDIENLVRNHRNHPSIILWSIGNEIPEQWSDEGREIARHLQELCHSLDPTRMVTQGMDKADEALHSGFAQVMDVPGFNYRVHKYGNNIKQLPQGFLLGSETASTVSSRGVYKFPVTISDSNTYPDGQCSSYDTEYCSWSNLPDDDWRWQDDYPWVVGEFVWTGFDYLGEPTPYDEYWPARSSYFGICDLAGLPKDRYYLYRSRWNTNDHTIHLLPHWTWPGREGQVTPVYCYTDYPEGELFVNGVSQGRIKKNREGRLDRYRLRWNDVVYQPGEIRVVVYDEKGKRAGEQIIRTAGDPAQLTLTTDRADIKAGQNDLAFITVNLVDADGNLVPDADDQLLFEVSGAGRFKAVCNGDATSLEPFTQPTMRLFHGQLVVIVEALDTTGPITLTVRSLKRNISQTVTLTAN